MIPAVEKDFVSLEACIESVVQFVPGVRRVLIVSPELRPPPQIAALIEESQAAAAAAAAAEAKAQGVETSKAPGGKGDGHDDSGSCGHAGSSGIGNVIVDYRWVHEGTELPELSRDVVASHLGPSGTHADPSSPRIGWYIQQVLKLRVFELLTRFGVGDRCLVLDADCVFHTQTPMVLPLQRQEEDNGHSDDDGGDSDGGSDNDGGDNGGDNGSGGGDGDNGGGDNGGGGNGGARAESDPTTATAAAAATVAAAVARGGGGTKGVVLLGTLPGYRHSPYFDHLHRLTKGLVTQPPPPPSPQPSSATATTTTAATTATTAATTAAANAVTMSGVCHHMLLDRRVLGRLEALVAGAWAEEEQQQQQQTQQQQQQQQQRNEVQPSAEPPAAVPLWQRFLGCVDPARIEEGAASEFELLFHFATQHCPDLVRVRPLSWRNSLGQVVIMDKVVLRQQQQPLGVEGAAAAHPAPPRPLAVLTETAELWRHEGSVLELSRRSCASSVRPRREEEEEEEEKKEEKEEGGRGGGGGKEAERKGGGEREKRWLSSSPRQQQQQRRRWVCVTSVGPSELRHCDVAVTRNCTETVESLETVETETALIASDEGGEVKVEVEKVGGGEKNKEEEEGGRACGDRDAKAGHKAAVSTTAVSTAAAAAAAAGKPGLKLKLNLSACHARQIPVPLPLLLLVRRLRRPRGSTLGRRLEGGGGGSGGGSQQQGVKKAPGEAAVGVEKLAPTTTSSSDAEFLLQIPSHILAAKLGRTLPAAATLKKYAAIALHTSPQAFQRAPLMFCLLSVLADSPDLDKWARLARFVPETDELLGMAELALG